MIEEGCNPTKTLSNEDLVRVKKYIEISPCYVYPRKISAKKPFTEEVRAAMTENVKQSAYKTMLSQNDKKCGGKVKNFADDDQTIYNFARSEVYKNASVRKPSRLNDVLGRYMKSVGQIMYDGVQIGTCFLVTDTLVITNYHVYREIKHIRSVPTNPNLPIFVRFDYFSPEERESLVTVEVDEEQDTSLENPYLDYKFFHLKQNEGLEGRVPLGPLVRNWQLSDGRVVIIGHPEGKEMHDEVCVVVGYRAMQERIRERYEECQGVHMTNSELLHKTENYQGSLSYDTTFFHGSSGSPIFEMNGYIVAMHTQAYTLERTQDDVVNNQEHVPNPEHENVPNSEHENVQNPENDDVSNPRQANVLNPENDDVPNQYEDVPNPVQEDVPNPVQEDVPNQEGAPNQEQESYLNEERDNVPNEEQENIPGQSNTRKYSLMEFGVQFTLICRDVRHWHGDEVVRRIFPYYTLKPGEKSMDFT